MKTARGVHWASINETSFVAGMRLLFWICRVFGRWPFRIVLYPVLAWYVATKPLARRASQSYLARINRITPVATGWLGVIRHFGAFAENILDKMLLWGGLIDTAQVRLHGTAAMDRLVAQGRGAVLVCSHLGNIDLCRVLSHQQKQVKLTVLVHTRHARAFNDMLATLDPRSQMNLMQVTEITPATAMLLSERVERGEFVVIAGDRVPVTGQGRVVMVPFLGSLAAFPIGPYVLAAALQCPICLMFPLRGAAGHEVHFEQLSDTVGLPRKGRDAALAALAAAYAARLAHFAARSPLEWFNFYDFWQPQSGQDDASS